MRAKWRTNTVRLVRSAIHDERYCSYILDVLHSEQYVGLSGILDFWKRARVSDLTVHEFIRQERKA